MTTTRRPTWQAVENAVRAIASIKFGAPARAEDIAGVHCDCVLRIGLDEVVLVEITEEETLAKLRIDLGKFSVLRAAFLQQNCFARCFFVTAREPSPSLIAAGAELKVKVLSVFQFYASMLGTARYVAARERSAFGSSIDVYSGKPDPGKYIDVEYVSDDGERYSAKRIAQELIEGRALVLLGEYGAGKSRCVREVFLEITHAHANRLATPIAINLRDNWGLKRAAEILTRHFDELGLTDDVADLLKVRAFPSLIYLLDGFDEIGAQTWSDDPTKLVQIRQHSLTGVKDIVTTAGGGILLTGREHYFNNDVELLECLGLTDKDVKLLRCSQELTEDQFAQLSGVSHKNLPPWVPKKPLIGIVLRDLDPVMLSSIYETSSGQIEFWELLLDTFCKREAQINPILDQQIIRSLYSQIGRLARGTDNPFGPISIKSINNAFENVTGRPPTDESAIILQRLPGLSRIGAESLDRRFIDLFILDGLKGDDVFSVYSTGDLGALRQVWRHPLGEFGAQFLATRITNANQSRGFLAFLRRYVAEPNRVLLSDMLLALSLTESDPLDFGGTVFKGGKFTQFNLGESCLRRVIFDDCIFEQLDFTDASSSELEIKNSVIIHAGGISSASSMPDWVSNCEIEDFEVLQTLTSIKQAGLQTSQTFLLSSLRKLFFQPGSGRKHSSMFKGYADSASKKICEAVIGLLVREKFCAQHRGRTENLYIPDRSKTARARLILSQMTQSSDHLWIAASRIR